MTHLPSTPTPLTVDDLVAHLQKIQQMGGGQQKAAIPYTPPHTTMGGRPCVMIEGVGQGFDWDHGKVFLYPDRPLGCLDQEQKAHAQKLENELGLLLFSIRKICSDEMFSTEERLRQISDAVENITRPSPSRAPRR